jgi:hypothetical protein
MPKKRPFKTQTKEQYIKNMMRTSKEVLAGFSTPEEAKECHANLWFEKFAIVNNDYSATDLLNPAREALRIEGGIAPTGNKGKLLGFNGLWRIYIHPRSRKSLDFDIAVKAGRQYRFHSKVIRQSILSRHGKSAYDQWRQMVKEDLESLRVLVQEVQSCISTVPWSYTCSQSAANLCEQVGISTYRGIAFLFPDSFSDE